MRAVRLIGALVLAASALTSGAAHAGAATQDPGAQSVHMTVLDVVPNTPVLGTTPQPLTFTLQVTNTSTETLDPLTISAERSDPIGSAAELEQAIKAPKPPTPDLAGTVLPDGRQPITVALLPGQSQTVTVPTVSQRANDGQGLCLCRDLIYPIYFSATWQSPTGAIQAVGSTQTYLPSFPTPPEQPVRVAWVWPLLDRPHRLSSDTTFLDDDLADSVRAGGRLDALLQVAEQVAAHHVRFTVVLDPELVDELAVMTSGYRVADGSDQPVAGTGGPDAQAWLDRLVTVIGSPDTQLVLTPYADPDFSALTNAGLPWADALPAAMRQRVLAALGGYLPPTDVAWPAGSHIDAAAAAVLAGTGIRTLLVGPDSVASSDTLPAGSGRTVQVRTDPGTLTVLQVPGSVADGAEQAVRSGGRRLQALPTLIARLAVPAVEDPGTPHSVLLLPDRDLAPDPAAAVRAVLGTAQTSWADSSTVEDLVTASAAIEKPSAELEQGPVDVLDPAVLGAITAVGEDRQAVTSMIGDKESGARFEGMDEAIERMKSGGWSAAPERARAAAGTLDGAVHAVTDGVQLVVPSGNGSYTLGSNDSPLPITIANNLDVPVSVRLSLTAVGGVPGFHADDTKVWPVDPQSKKQVKVPVHLDRAGRIPIRVRLVAPAPTSDGTALVLGKSLELSVRSTGLGRIGKIITWGAGAVLALLLCARAVRQLLRRRKAAAR